MAPRELLTPHRVRAPSPRCVLPGASWGNAADVDPAAVTLLFLVLFYIESPPACVITSGDSVHPLVAELTSTGRTFILKEVRPAAAAESLLVSPPGLASCYFLLLKSCLCR